MNTEKPHLTPGADEHRPWRRLEAPWVFSRLMTLFPAPEIDPTGDRQPHPVAVVHLGCGEGTLLRLVSEWIQMTSEVEVVPSGVEPDETLAARAKSHNPGLESFDSIEDLNEAHDHLDLGLMILPLGKQGPWPTGLDQDLPGILKSLRQCLDRLLILAPVGPGRGQIGPHRLRARLVSAGFACREFSLFDPASGQPASERPGFFGAFWHGLHRIVWGVSPSLACRIWGGWAGFHAIRKR